MPILTIASQKGGTGKTTTAVHLAAALALREKEVLLIDADPQSNATFCLGFNQAEVDSSLADVLLRDASLTALATQEGFSLVPGSAELAHITDRRLNLSPLFRQMPFEWIIVDTPPALNRLTLSCLQTAQIVLVTVDVRGLSVLQGADQTLQVLQALPNKRVVRIVPTMVDRRLRVTDRLLQELNQLGIPTCTPIRINSKLAEAAIRGDTVFKFAGSCRGAKDYKALAEEVLGLAESQG